MKIGFMGSPEFSVPTLEILNNSNHNVEVVYTQPPRPKGRGKEISPCPVHAKANELGISVLNPTDFKSDEDIDKLKSFDLDLLVVVAYGIILPQSVLDIPKYGCINGHASILPRWRGAAPIQRAIQAGDSETGVCVMQMDAGLDTGDVITEAKISIPNDMTGGNLHDKLMDLTATEIMAVVNNIDNVKPIPQSENGITYADKLFRAEATVDWNNNATDIANTVRAFNPFPMCQTNLNEQVIKILQANVSSDTTDKVAGTIINDNPFLIACGNGTVLEIITLQKAGKNPVSVKDFLNGNKINIGEVIS
ncbi:MAG: methionyl-tRNA formyltransferase [Alphaproteobacteria bacterium]